MILISFVLQLVEFEFGIPMVLAGQANRDPTKAMGCCRAREKRNKKWWRRCCGEDFLSEREKMRQKGMRMAVRAW